MRFDILRLCLINQELHASGAGEFSQEVAAIQLKNVIVGVDQWQPTAYQSEINLRSKAQLEISYVDFMMLASHHFIPPCNLQYAMHIFVDRGQNGGSAENVQLESQLNAKHVVARFGHFASHTIQNINRLWNNDKHEHFWTSICLRNATAHYLKIGQTDTEEALVLQPSQKVQPYIWRSQKARLMLCCSTESAIQPGIWKRSEPFSIREGVITAKINHEGYINTLVISMKRDRFNRFKIVINGLVSTANLLSEHLEVRLVFKKNYTFLANFQDSSGKTEDWRSITAANSAGHSHIIEPSYIHCIKVRLNGIGTPWSGDIPLNEPGRRDSVRQLIVNNFLS